ncbi:uncharacterized protein MKK02DRAFT_39454 [Dioszegia hungarica]|uniref:Uncharacterized protein n=1 Tax=Dioszegia hungarica TaxID=4972 RepID=A0AA38HGM7_9TREE|nr:uncharacterized protein MKK02DRAFT_39454 [Dioszegia hungarica]KAI9639161.1 hypothetical protein MKK02DRAFT_39454 [Dioszegia hungarica]
MPDPDEDAAAGTPPHSPPAKLLPEIYAEIFRHLLRPPPLLSERAERRNLSQADLALLMRTSRLFNQIAAPYLYSTIRTCNLSSLTYGLDTFSVLGVPSKFELLNYTRKLYLEYIEKGEPGYTNLLAHGGAYFHLVEPTGMEASTFAHEECRAVTEGMALALVMKAFRNLTSISTGSYTGRQGDYYKRLFGFRSIHPDLPGMMFRAGGVLIDLAADVPVESVCQWVGTGPLTFETPRKPLLFRAHISTESAAIPVCLGRTSRWYYDVQPPAGGPDTEAVLGTALHALVYAILLHAVERFIAVQSWPKIHPAAEAMYGHTSIHLDIFLADRFAQTPILQALRSDIPTTILRMYELLGLPSEWCEKDVWTFEPIGRAPACEACYWSPTVPPNQKSPLPSLSLMRVKGVLAKAYEDLIPRARSLLEFRGRDESSLGF